MELFFKHLFSLVPTCHSCIWLHDGLWWAPPPPIELVNVAFKRTSDSLCVPLVPFVLTDLSVEFSSLIQTIGSAEAKGNTGRSTSAFAPPPDASHSDITIPSAFSHHAHGHICNKHRKAAVNTIKSKQSQPKPTKLCQEVTHTSKHNRAPGSRLLKHRPSLLTHTYSLCSLKRNTGFE